MSEPVVRIRDIAYVRLRVPDLDAMERFLGDFGLVRDKVERFVASNADYQTNRFELSSEKREEIARRWAGYIAQHGY